jgi:hypothetical protein
MQNKILKPMADAKFFNCLEMKEKKYSISVKAQLKIDT